METVKPGADSANSQLWRKTVAIIIFLIVAVLAFFVVRPYLSAIFFGMVLAFILHIPYTKLNRVIKKPPITSAIFCVLVVLALLVGFYFIVQITVKEAFNLYISIQKLDIFNTINAVLTNIFPDSPELSREITVMLQQALTTITNVIVNQLGQIITNAPQIIIQFFITFFVMFFCLKDGPKVVDYMRSILPFSERVKKRLAKSSKDITYATIYGQVLVGVIQGLVAGIGLYIFKAPSPLFFTLIASFLGIIPFLGPWLILFPIALVMIMTGSLTNGIFLMVWTILIVSTIDNFLRPVMIGRKARINPVLVLVGMLGGLLFMGPIGLIAGPIILQYLFILLDIYRKKGISAFVLKEEELKKQKKERTRRKRALRIGRLRRKRGKRK